MEADFSHAKELMSAGKYAEAANAYLEIAGEMPKCKEAWDNAAFALICAGDVAAAADCCSEIIRRYPKDHETMYRRAILELKAGFREEALDSIGRALRLNPKCAEYLYTLGCIYYEQKKINEAIAAFNEAVICDPYHYIAADHICLCLLSLESFSELAAFCLQCIRKYEPFVEGDFERLGNGDGNESGNEKENVAVLNEMPESLKGFGKNNLLSFYNYLSLGCLRSGDYEDAYRFLKIALTFEPENVMLINYLAMTQTALGKYDEAALSFRKVMELNPESANARTSLAFVLSRSDNEENINEAVAIYKSLIEENEMQNRDDPVAGSGNRKLFTDAAKAYQKAGLLQDALDIYAKILEKSPNALVAYEESSRILFRTGEYEKAVKMLENGCSLDPYNLDMVNLLAVTYMNLGRIDDAEEMFKKAVEIEPWSPKAYYNEGIARLKSDQYEKAAECFRKAAECAPDDVAVQYYLGVADTECGLYEEALECFEKVESADPDYEDVQQCLTYLRESLDEEKRNSEN